MESVSNNVFDDALLYKFEKGAHFLDYEISDIKDILKDKNLSIKDHKKTFYIYKLCQLVNIKLNIPINKALYTKVNLYIKFKSYKGVDMLSYEVEEKNYYYLPDEIQSINLVMDGITLNIKEKDYDIINYKSDIGILKLHNYYKLNNNNIANINDRYNLYKLSESLFHIYKYTNDIYEKLILDIVNYKSLHNSDIYISYLKNISKLLKDYESQNKRGNYIEAITVVNNELFNNSMNADNLHNIVVGHKNLDYVIECVIKASQNSIHIKISTFLELMERAQKEKFYDIRLGMLCEKFICEDPIILDYGFDFLSNIYKEKGLNTQYTTEVIKIIRTYFNNELLANELLLQNKINICNFNIEFTEAFISYYNIKGCDEFIIKCLDRMIHYEYHLTEELLKVMYECYSSMGKNNHVLLEEILFNSMKNSKMLFTRVVNESAGDFREYYLKNNIYSKKALILMLEMDNEEQGGIENLIVQMLKQEEINLNNNKECYVHLEGLNGKIFVDEKVSNEKQLNLNLGFIGKLYYTIDGESKVLHRICGKERYFEKLLSFYHKVEDKEFREYCFELCINRNIYNEEIYNEYIAIDNRSEYVKKAYEITFRNKGMSSYEEDNGKSIDMLKKYIEHYDIHQNYMITKTLLLRTMDEDVSKAVEIAALIELKNAKSAKNVFYSMISKALNENKIDHIIYIFISLIDEECTNPENIKLFLRYLEKAQITDNIIVEAIKKYYTKNSKDIQNMILNQLILKEDTLYKVEILWKLNFISTSNVIIKEIKRICVKNPKWKYEIDIIENVVFNLKNDIVDMIKLSRNCEKNDKIYEIILKVVEENFNVNNELAIELLYNIREYSKAKDIMDFIEDGLIGKYLLKEKYKGNYYNVSNGKDVFKNTICEEVVSISQEVFEYLDEYQCLNGIKLENIEGHYFLNTLNEKWESILEENSLTTVVEWFIRLVRYERKLMEKGISLTYLDFKNTIITENGFVPLKAYEKIDKKKRILIEKNSEYVEEIAKILVRKRSLLNIKEASIVQIFMTFIKNIFEKKLTLIGPINNKEKKKDAEEFYYIEKNIINNSSISTLESLLLELKNMVNEINDIENINILSRINNFDVIGEKKKKETYMYIIKNDIQTEEAKSIIFSYNFEEIEIEVVYVILYMFKCINTIEDREHKRRAKYVQKILVMHIENLIINEEMEGLLIDFIINSLDYKSISKNECLDLVNRVEFKSERNKRYLQEKIRSY